jgi:hypothetical protein
MFRFCPLMWEIWTFRYFGPYWDDTNLKGLWDDPRAPASIHHAHSAAPGKMNGEYKAGDPPTSWTVPTAYISNGTQYYRPG